MSLFSFVFNVRGSREKKIMNAKNFSGRVMTENLIGKLRLVLSYEDPRVISFWSNKNFLLIF